MPTMVADLDTPAVVIDLDIVEANISRAQDTLASHGLANRPHIKTHKIPALAKLQMEAGAVGITCQKLGEVEVMADAGVADDILLTYNVLGDAKTERLAALIRRLKRMAVVLDNEVVARGLSEAGKRHGVDIRFLIECDTGFGRNGVQSPQAALDLAREAMRMPNMQFEGLMTFPTAKPEQRLWLERALQLLNGAGIAVPVVSGGGSPALKGCGDFPMLTEYRAGTYIYNDVMQVTAGRRHLGRLRHDGARDRGQPPDRGPRGARCRLQGDDLRAVLRQGLRPHRRISRRAGHRLLRGARHRRPLGLREQAEDRRGGQRDPEPLLRRHQHDGRGLRGAERQGRGGLSGRGARQGAVNTGA